MKSIRPLFKTITVTAPYALIQCIKISKIFGRSWSYFTATSVITPAISTMLSYKELLGLTIIRTALHLISSNTLTLFKLTYHIPSFAGAWYFKELCSSHAKKPAWWCAFAPLACMALFVLNPVGGQAWVYSLYWLIPAVLALLPVRNVFLSALGSTFMTHAVGSLFFLYTTPMAPAFWLGLLPMVIVERLTFALGITLAYYALTYISRINTGALFSAAAYNHVA